MSNIFSLKKSYNIDGDKISEWFAEDIKSLKNAKPNMVVLPGILTKLRSTYGLENELEFIQDIYNDLELSVHMINMCVIKPLSPVYPWISKIRSEDFDPRKDRLFDHSLPTRNCMLYVPINRTKSSIHWIDRSEHIVDEEIKTKKYNIIETTEFNDSALIVRSDTACMFDNTKNPDYLLFLQIAFDDNPTFLEIVEKYWKLS